MCGIVAYVGDRPCKELILTGLERLEYRGYDSAGFALQSTGPDFEIVRSVGKLADLRAVSSAADPLATTGVGHTRWATHGRVTQANAHPHADGEGRIAVVMNGIIENYVALRAELIAEGVTFTSETDTEVLPHMIARAYQGDLAKAVADILPLIQGHYAFVAMHASEPGRLVGAREECPLVVGIGEGERFVASAIPAFLRETVRSRWSSPATSSSSRPVASRFRQGARTSCATLKPLTSVRTPPRRVASRPSC